MISEKSIKFLAEVFCGDKEDFYKYKSGPTLVSFFNNYFDYNDTYGQGFPSRWAYTYDKIIDLSEHNRLDSFIDLILGHPFIMRDSDCSEVEAVEKSNEILSYLNRVLGSDQMLVSQSSSGYRLIEKNKDLILIGSGGFADVYRQASTGIIIKKLKSENIADKGARSRFKREFVITKSLQDLSDEIITVFSYDEGSCSYTMESADETLEEFINRKCLSEEEKTNCIRRILSTMSKVHERDIIHRDLSPNNIFIINNKIKIADFGLGKDLNLFASYQTLYTNAVGQYCYCAPEQFLYLKDADKKSDVYSLGRIINFIMTGNPGDSHHVYRNVAEKATNGDAEYRYSDAAQLLKFFEESVDYHSQEENKQRVEEKIRKNIFDNEVECYLYDMSDVQLSKKILSQQGNHFTIALISFMSLNEENAQYVIKGVEKSFREVCGRSFAANDPFAAFAASIISGTYSFVVKEIAANILRYVAWDVNRFSAQHLVEGLIEDGIDLNLEKIIKG